MSRDKLPKPQAIRKDIGQVRTPESEMLTLKLVRYYAASSERLGPV